MPVSPRVFKKVSILRFCTWLSTEGVGHLSDAPSTRRFNAAEYCKDAEAVRLLIYTKAEGMVILQELYQSILSSIEAAGSCTFLYLKSVFVDWLCLSDQKDIPNVDEKLTTLLEYARKMQQVFLVEINGEQAPLLNMDRVVYYGTSLLKEVENRQNAQERLSRTTGRECSVYTRESCNKRQKDCCEVHSGRGGVKLQLRRKPNQRQRFEQSNTRECLSCVRVCSLIPFYSFESLIPSSLSCRSNAA